MAMGRTGRRPLESWHLRENPVWELLLGIKEEIRFFATMPITMIMP